MNITPTDLEVMENEMVVKSGRVSIESSRSQQLSINSARAALSSTTPRYQRTVVPSLTTRGKLPSRNDELKQRIQKLEKAISERDHLVLINHRYDL